MPTKRLLWPVFLLVIAAISCGAEATPSIAVASHHDRQTVRDSAITLSGTATDPAGVTSITVSLNRGPEQEAAWNGSGAEPPENASWSIPLKLSEGANIIVVNATDSANETATLTILIDYSIPQGSSAGVILSVGSILVGVLLIALVAFRVRGAPPPEEEAASAASFEGPKDESE